ncbi:MAG: cupin domain-containing protein [Pseudohongiellaceae bacterium]|jgi:mannose-6-phosphate isomerase-like protein (cupin superfamily)
MHPFILHRDPTRSYFTEELCHINELCNTPDDPTVSVAEARVAPGVTTRWHRLRGTVERYVIQSGSGVVDVGDLPPTPVTVGSVVVIPPGCRQRIRNTGSSELVFLAICSPRFEPRHYEDVEHEVAR